MKLYVGNLAFSVTDTDLREVFAPFGTVTDAFVLMDNTTRRSRGFGFVTMSNQAEGEAAIAGLNGQEVNGRRLTINEARPMEERAPRGNGGGGYGGGGGGGRSGGGRFDDRKPRRDFR
jgi:RNA recognition motif-containing protein